MTEVPYISGSFRHVLSPPGMAAAQRSRAKEQWYINDHCFVVDDSGTIHWYGVTNPYPQDGNLYGPGSHRHIGHAVARDPFGPWEERPDAFSLTDGDNRGSLGACWVERQGDGYIMIYSNFCNGGFCFAHSRDLDAWTPLELNLSLGNGTRDPCVLRLDDGSYLIYGAAGHDGMSVVAAARSSDLLHWTPCAPALLSDIPNVHGALESPCVHRHGEDYFLFLNHSHRQYEETLVFRSRDPLHFDWNKPVCTLFSHAAEILAWGGKTYISHCGLEDRHWSDVGAPYGLWLAPLEWFTQTRRAVVTLNPSGPHHAPIDRRALVDRHSPRLRRVDPLCPFSVGNGEFAFTADITGLQTFPESYDAGIPLGTMSQWGWRSEPPPSGSTPADFAWTDFDTYGRPVPYPYTGAQTWFGVKPAYWPLDPAKEARGAWMRRNPHRIHLGLLGLDLEGDFQPGDLTDIDQSLDLWSGMLISRFSLGGRPVRVRTACHPELDLVAAIIESPLLTEGCQLGIRLSFPGATPAANHGKDWLCPERHTTEILAQTPSTLLLQRRLDATAYYARLEWTNARLLRGEPHVFRLAAEPGSDRLAVVLAFASGPLDQALPTAEEVFSASALHWATFWQSGGAIELAGSRDPRADELERRIVLSQYLTAIQSCGSAPPAETGLTCNSWYGKFHLEMHWWHAAHFAFWGRLDLLKRSLAWYRNILPQACATARCQGYRGARWPKQTSLDGAETPSSIGPLIIWQQPHPLLYAEYCWREAPCRATLDEHAKVVEATADFMASYAHFDPVSGFYVLGPPLIPAQENHDPLTTRNPTFELAYWAFGLRLAQSWRERMGLPRQAHWDDVIRRLAPLPVQDGVYLAHERCPDTYTHFNLDHPSMLGAYGMIPGPNVDPDVMARTLDRVVAAWRWNDTWGWDCPLAAMTAARLGRPAQAVDLLMMDAPRNRYGTNGHCAQFDGLPLYLPANGGLLAAAAMMATGWDDGPTACAPGFPSDGSWTVRHEGLRQFV